MIERRVVFDPVDRALAVLDEFGGFDLGSDGELPVGSGLALRDDGVREIALADDFACNLKMVVDR